MNRDERIVVVGAGLTGLRAAERLRELKFEGEVMLIGEERLPPYHRPALSKQLLMGTLRPSDLTLPAYEDINAKWRFGTQVRYLLPRNRTLQLPGGEEITYDGLIIATGVEARRPSDVPYHDPRVLVLRTMRDAMDLERVVGSTRGRVAIVGGGFTGCELAASLRHLRREVTLIGRSDNLLGNVLGPELGEWLTTVHRDHGVDLALGNSVQDWTPGPEGITLRLTDGSTVLASCVLVAAGTVPTTGWLRGSGLPLDNGVVCDASCHVVGADDIVAAGDVAQWPNLRFDNEPRRVEHWLNAVEMGRAAAESLLAGRVAAEPFTPMPRFWTEQYGIRIQAAGMPKLGADVITLGTPDEGTGTVYGYSREGRLMGVVGLDCPSSVLAWTESVSRQNPAPRQRITAGSTPSLTPSVSSQKRRAGRHTLPAKEKQTKRATPREHDIGYVEEPSEPGRAISAPPATVGRPKNVVDSFSRMLPVSVRPASSSGRRAQPSSPQTGPDGHPVIPGRVPAAGDPSSMATGPNGFPVITGADFQAGNGTGRGYPAGGGNGRALLGPGTQPQNGRPGHPSGRFDVPAPNGRPIANNSGRFDVPEPAAGFGHAGRDARPVAGASGRFDVPESAGGFDHAGRDGRASGGGSGRFDVPESAAGFGHTGRDARPVAGASGRFDVPESAGGFGHAGRDGRGNGGSGRFDVPELAGGFDHAGRDGRASGGGSGRFDVPELAGQFDHVEPNGRSVAGGSGRFDVPEPAQFERDGRAVATPGHAPVGRPDAGGRRAVPPTRNGRRRVVSTAVSTGGPDTGSHSGQFDAPESTDRILPPRYRELEPSAELAPRDRSEETSVESIPLYRDPAPAEPAPRYREPEPATSAPRYRASAPATPRYSEPEPAASPRYRASEPAATSPRYREPEPAALAPRYSASESVGSASRSRPAAAAVAPRYSEPEPELASRGRESVSAVSAPRYRAAESGAERPARYRAAEPPAVTAPRFREPESPAELSGGPRHRAEQPEPLSGRLNPADALPIDVTGQMALLDANGHVRAAGRGQPERRAAATHPRDPYARGDAAHDRLKLVPAITTATDPFERRPRHGRPDDYDFESLPVVRQRPGPEDSYDSMPPVRRSGGRRRG
jgi:NADPH-dependent 2,4-dienoyl-CoA reductase/sulfur reductase-like enzyme